MMSAIIGMAIGFIWGWSGILAQSFWWKRTFTIVKQSSINHILSAINGPIIVYLMGYFVLNENKEYDFFGRNIIKK